MRCEVWCAWCRGEEDGLDMSVAAFRRFGSLAKEHAQQWGELPEGARRKGAWRYVGGEGKGEAGAEASGAAEARRESGGQQAGGTGEAATEAAGAAGAEEEFEYYCDITDAKIDMTSEGRYHYG